MAEQIKPRGSTLMHTLKGIQVLSTGGYAPDKLVRNEDLVQYGMDPDWIVQRTGIRERRHAPPEQATSDLCVACGSQALERAEVPPDEVDLLVLGTFTPDYEVASAAAMVQDRLGLSVPAIEISAACAGFMYALVTAAQFLKTGACHKALVIGGDCNSRVIDPVDPKVYPLFGDGAGAVVLAHGAPEQGLLAYTLGADGSGTRMLYKQMGGSKIPVSHAAIDAGLNMLEMDGRGVFKWAVRVLCDTVVDALRHASLEIDDIDLFVFHQANLRIIEAGAEYLKIDSSKLVVNIDRYGNTTAGSIPLALDEAVTQGRVKRGDHVLLSGFGAGLNWGTAILRW